MKIKPLIGPHGKMPILIRDDDTNFFTRPDMLEPIHSKAWDKGFKISLSVVPFQRGTEDVRARKRRLQCATCCLIGKASSRMTLVQPRQPW